MLNSQIVTVSFFRYLGPAARWWAFQQMGLAPAKLQTEPGLQFVKMLGSGNGNGFSIWPNFGVYGLLGVWTDEAAARQFFAHSPQFANFRAKAAEIWTTYLRTAVVHGQWDGGEPFAVTTSYQDDLPVAVLTRATIRLNRLWHFWRFVPRVSKAMWSNHQDGLLFSVGIGELPLIQQATFSLWSDSKKMKSYAYQSAFHREVIQQTRALNWYKEELFARFHPFASEGQWNGKTILTIA